MATGAAGKLNFMADAPLESTSRERFLVAADEQFIESGYDRCTIRAIAARAGTSLASLSRNWSGKRELFVEVFKRHFDPIHAAQNASFDALEAQGNFSARAVIAAFFGSGMTCEGTGMQKIRRVYSLALLDPSEEARAITRQLAEPVRQRLIVLLRRCLPHLDERRFFLAMNVVLGVYIYPLARGERLASVMGYDLAGFDWEAAVDILADMACRGIEG
jgi:AcrR family transcriptional regulator